MTKDSCKDYASTKVSQDYYDGAADEIYRDIWGENIHLGVFESQDEPLPDAMKRTNEIMVREANLSPDDTVFEVGCGYGATARYLAETVGCSVLATNISKKQLAWAEELTRKRGLDDKVSYAWADFHCLEQGDDSFDVYWCQESLLHACPKEDALAEAARILKPGGRMVFSELLVREDAPEEVYQKVLDRLSCKEMWGARKYRAELEKLGFEMEYVHDWSENVALTYGWVQSELERRYDEFVSRIGAEAVDKTLRGLAFWVKAGRREYIGWISAKAVLR